MKTLLITFLLLASLPCFGQNTRTCRAIFLERPKEAPEEAFLFDGVTSKKISLSGVQFSEVILLPADGIKLSLCPNEVQSAEELPAGAPSVVIAADATDFYLVITSDPNSQILPVRIELIGIGKYPAIGETLWVNRTDYGILAKLGELDLEIAPMTSVVSHAPLKENGYFEAEFQYQADPGKAWLPVMKKSWWFDSTSRNVGFIISNGRRLPEIYTVRDRR